MVPALFYPTVKSCKDLLMVAFALMLHSVLILAVETGVHIRNGGAGEFIGCTLESNQEVGLLVEDPNSNPHLKECVLTTSGGSGAVFRGTSVRGVLHQCTIDNNCGYGVEIVDCANPCLTECTITNGKLHGVYATHCTGVLEGCTISNFEHDGNSALLHCQFSESDFV